MEENTVENRQLGLKIWKVVFLLAFILILFFTNFLSYKLGHVSGDKLFTQKSLQAKEHINNKNVPDELKDQIDFDSFWKAWAILDEKFVEGNIDSQKSDVTDNEKLWGAISGLTRSYNDPYTNFFPPDENQIFESDIEGEFVGVGIEIGYRSGYLTVVSPLSDTPAFKAGMKAGDIISKINGVDSLKTTPTSAVKLIRGEKGTEVILTVIREGETGELDIPITRDTIKIPTIKTENLDSVFIIKLYSFSKESAKLTQNAFSEFAKSGKDKLVLDLRGNPGGLLEAAVQIASFFLEKGEIIVSSNYGKNPGDNTYRSFGYNVFSDKLKMVILTDKGSASASEILAGALRQHNKALLVGEKTFGKGSVQELIPVTKDTSLKVTVAKWILPDGNNISNEGIIPDFEVEKETASSTSSLNLNQDKDMILQKAIEILNSKDFFENFTESNTGTSSTLINK